jgi:5-methylcytosine-specific restriction endonuclease McrA
MRVTIAGTFKDDLETLKCLLSHKIPDGDLAKVLHEAVRCGIERHGKRRGAVKPERERKPAAGVPERQRKLAAPRPPQPPCLGERQPIPAPVKRAVWERDGGRCTYVSPGGHRCQSRWRLELDHVVPARLGGSATVANLRLRCRTHNTLHAEEVYGREHMVRFRKNRPAPRTGDAIAGDSALQVNAATAQRTGGA